MDAYLLTQSCANFRWIRENVVDWQQTVVCSPDEGGTRRAGILAEKLHLPMALIHKESFNEEHIISGNVQDKKVRKQFLCDDSLERN